MFTGDEISQLFPMVGVSGRQDHTRHLSKKDGLRVDQRKFGFLFPKERGLSCGQQTTLCYKVKNSVSESFFFPISII